MKRNEIWLEGQELEIAKYKKLYKKYGNTYGTPSDNKHFLVPNFIDRSIWGIRSTNNFGYISPALPNITGSFGCRGMENYGTQTSGAFYSQGSWQSARGDGIGSVSFVFNASRCSNLYKDNYHHVRPDALGVKVKTRYY